MIANVVIGVLLLAAIIGAIVIVFYHQYKKALRGDKNVERGLKMVPMLIHLPPESDDIQSGGRDERDITEETISQAQVLYNIVASTATKGFKSKIYGQRHLAFEIIASKGLIHYYIVVPLVLIDVVKQSVSAAYPSARLEEVEEENMFSPTGKVTGTIGGEFTLKKHYSYPIATYQDSKRDAMRALLNALSVAQRDDGVGVQILIRPAEEGWTKNVISEAGKIRKDKGKKSSPISGVPKDVLSAFWKAPESKDAKPEDKQLSTLEQQTIEVMEDKTRYPGYETLVRVVASSPTAARSQAILQNVVSSFALFDAPGKNGFKFSLAKDIETFVSSFIMRYFPQEIRQNILNSVELATVFHFPNQRNIPTSQLQRQASKQVDGPYQELNEGFLLGYNVFRGIKKPIRLGTNDRRRHTYIIGQTGTGKSKLLENLALQDMLDGKGFAFVDPHGDSAEELLGMVPKERVEDVIYFNPSDMDNPIGLNLFEFDSPDQRDFLVQEAIAMLYRLYDPGHTGIIGPRYEHWFRNAALTIMSDPGGSTFIDIPQVFNDDDFSKHKLKFVKDQTVLDFWNKEMAQTSDYHKSEVLGWFVSKFGAFLSNEMMRNIIGQTKSGFDLRDIMDNKKILLVNLSKGRVGELNSQLLGMIFVMKFQAAAMGRADVPEDQREDFSLYVDEFQNFATDSFASILSEARKYRLNLILANQFVSQLTDNIREAVIGNVGTIIAGRIGTTDAELMEKKFVPTFTAEDLTKLPNYESIATVMINGVPSSPFSMAFIPPLGKSNPKLAEALKKLSYAKHGQPRAAVEKEIFTRLRAGDAARDEKRKALQDKMKQSSVAGGGQNSAQPSTGAAQAGGSSFLDEWLAKRKAMQSGAPKQPSATNPAPAKVPVAAPITAPKPIAEPPASKPVQSIPDVQMMPNPPSPASAPVSKYVSQTPPIAKPQSTVSPEDSNRTMETIDDLAEKTKQLPNDTLQIRRPASEQPVQGSINSDEEGEIYIDVRGNLHHRQDANSS